MHESAGGSGRRASKPFPVSVSLRSYKGREAETVTSWVDDGTLGVSRATRERGTEGSREEEGGNFPCRCDAPQTFIAASRARIVTNRLTSSGWNW